MNTAEAKQFLAGLLTGVTSVRKEFTRKTYVDCFTERFNKALPDLLRLDEAYHTAEDREAFLAEIGNAPADASYERMQSMPKRKRDVQQMEDAMTMVTFVIPLLLEYESDFMEDLTDCIVARWVELNPKYVIQKATYEEINAGFKRKFCFITSAVCRTLGKPDDCYELTLLRGYRDGYLSDQENGEELIRLYYDIAPTVVKRIDRRENAGEIYASIYENYLLPCIRMIEAGENERCRMTYESMVYDLQKEYVYS